jgi:hypothetical protein
MSTPSGEDALRALLAEHAPGYAMDRPRLREPLILPVDSERTMIAHYDEANDMVHTFVCRTPVGPWGFTALLTQTARMIHAPLN